MGQLPPGRTAMGSQIPVSKLSETTPFPTLRKLITTVDSHNKPLVDSAFLLLKQVGKIQIEGSF